MLHHGTRCRVGARQTMESSYGSGTPTMRSEKADVTSTGFSAVPQGASSLRTRALDLLQGILLQGPHHLPNANFHSGTCCKAFCCRALTFFLVRILTAAPATTSTSMHVNQAKLRRTSPRERCLCPLPSLPAPPCKGNRVKRLAVAHFWTDKPYSVTRAAYTLQTRSAASVWQRAHTASEDKH